ncbi:DNA-packaging protein [Breoghania sp. JC706]|uniref:DNA-packaging protein n=1 Tax=Breoghania sp. JC706 TaxID=3117732 RepID=UPI0030080643
MSDVEEGGRDDKGRFLPGNRFWEVRSSAGPKPKFTVPEQLWNCCCEYFAWVEENPLFEDKLVAFQGSATHEAVARMRVMTLAGLCMFLDIDTTTWQTWRKDRPDLSRVITRAEDVIRTQKFEGAAVDLLNANIIARDLGLADRSELSGKNGGPIRS